ncbi:hypothetical protein Oweho_0831 [Owenweeksia hongkongensis DSM 17368]|uniref:DUF4235 domain-containing protein n=1 Tax=Owenweeksia hongkongensis (strain DSM 17368 / CIP 108786 / JCM 12287 / NRRL B-23963 / UST20020801) TaxID=926562 RepID=G8R2N9_OWEHD|nr:DUF4235 domain-containing protein [Owenweeksia hongkongensis]AEV31844.1 hypothetical protein Oweho_0831 [Owenweeksia hongkongensis DSM 17368]
MNISEKQAKEIAVGLGALAAGFFLKRIMEKGYEGIFDKEPPNAVKDEDINWLHVIGWSVITGFTATMLKVGIKRMGGKYLD